MNFAEKHEAFATIFGLVIIFWSLSVIVMAAALCFTGSIVLLKCITSLAVLLAFAVFGVIFKIMSDPE